MGVVMIQERTYPRIEPFTSEINRFSNRLLLSLLGVCVRACCVRARRTWWCRVLLLFFLTVFRCVCAVTIHESHSILIEMGVFGLMDFTLTTVLSALHVECANKQPLKPVALIETMICRAK